MNPWRFVNMISVIVPVYNVEKYIEKCLDSVLSQTYSNLEILVIDDGSTDQSGIICDKYSKRDKRIRVFHKKNEGLAAARNLALEYMMGDYVACVDSDDYLEKDMYECLMEKMHEDIDIVTCGINNIYPVDAHKRNYVSYRAHECSIYDNQEAIRELFLWKTISFSSCDKLFRGKLFEGVRYPKGKVCEDLPVLYKLVSKSRNIVNIGKAKYNYIYRSDSISRKSFYDEKIYFAIFSQKILIDIQKNYPDIIEEALAWYINNIVSVLEDIIQSPKRKDYNKQERQLRLILRRRVFDIIKNSYISRERKDYYYHLLSDSNNLLGHTLRGLFLV